MLGKFVIIHGAEHGPAGQPLYLGAAGWSPHRPSALTFWDEVSAHDWLADYGKRYPKLVAGASHKVEVSLYDPTEPVRPAVLSDYEPIP